MHYFLCVLAISYINLPKTYDEAILAQFVVHHATNSNRTIRVECLRCHDTCQIFKCQFAVGQLLVYCRPRVGRQYTDRLLGELFFTFTLNSTPVKTKYYFVAFVIITRYCCYSKIKCSLLLPPMSSSSLFCKNSIPPYQSGLASLQLSACVVAVFHLKKIIIISSFELITAKGDNISQPMDIEQNCAKNFHSG